MKNTENDDLGLQLQLDFQKSKTRTGKLAMIFYKAFAPTALVGLTPTEEAKNLNKMLTTMEIFAFVTLFFGSPFWLPQYLLTRTLSLGMDKYLLKENERRIRLSQKLKQSLIN